MHIPLLKRGSGPQSPGKVTGGTRSPSVVLDRVSLYAEVLVLSTPKSLEPPTALNSKWFRHDQNKNKYNDCSRQIGPQLPLSFMLWQFRRCLSASRCFLSLGNHRFSGAQHEDMPQDEPA